MGVDREKMNWQTMFTKRRILLIGLVAVLAVLAAVAYVNSPTILLWLNPQDSISISGVSYPAEVYRSQNLPVTVYLSNIGDSKDALVELISKDNPILSNVVLLESGNSVTNTTIWLPIRSAGDQACTVKVSWIGPGGFCKLEQNSTDKSFKALAADYDFSSMPKFASRAQEFDWTLTVKNIGNTPADLTVQLTKKDPLIVSPSDTKQINIQVGETRSVDFHFIVPSSADMGDHTITVSFITTYPDTAYYKNCKETTTRDYVVTIQESTVKTQIDNAGYIITAVLALGGGVAAFTTLRGRRRR
jgi:hypothetical protein